MGQRNSLQAGAQRRVSARGLRVCRALRALCRAGCQETLLSARRRAGAQALRPPLPRTAARGAARTIPFFPPPQRSGAFRIQSQNMQKKELITMKNRILTALAALVLLLSCIALPGAWAENAAATQYVGSDYTVEFTYGDSTYVLAGGSAAPLTDILACLGLTGKVTDVSVSDPSLFAAEKADNWRVQALAPFDSQEWLRVTLDGVLYELTVTDDNTTQNVPDGEYTGTGVETRLKGTPAVDDDTYVNNADKPANVKQSTSATSATTFAAGLPLSTIYIDQTMIGTKLGKYNAINDNPLSENLIYNQTTGRVMYDAIYGQKMLPGIINKLEGDLFYFIFEDAALLPDGTRADLKITYSDARIVVDERWGFAPKDEQYYHGYVNLATGSDFTYGGTDTTNFSKQSFAAQAQSAVNQTAYSYYEQTFYNNSQKYPMLGQSLDATYQIVDKDGIPVNGTFIFAICGINLDRDPYRQRSNNSAKPLWYVNDFKDENGKNIGEAFHFFSEAMSINDGMASDYIYVRPNTYLDDSNKPSPEGVENYAFFYPQVIKDSSGNTKFISNAYGTGRGIGNGHDNCYNSGFVVLADAAAGFRVTATGHGNDVNAAMHSNAFSSTTIWYRYKSESSAGGTIKTTSEGNYGGTLDDTSETGVLSNLLEPGTYVVPEGKTVIYTLTPETGYHISTLRITTTAEDGASDAYEIKYNNKPLSEMPENTSVDFEYAPGKTGTLTAKANGEFILTLPHADHHEYIRVDWDKPLGELKVKKFVPPVIPVADDFDFTVVAYKDKDNYTANLIFSVWNESNVLTNESGAISTALKDALDGIQLEERIPISSTNEVWKTNATLADIGQAGNDVLYVNFWRAANAAEGDTLGEWLGKERIYFYTLTPNQAEDKIYWNFEKNEHQDDYCECSFTLTANGTEEKFEIPYDYEYVVREASKQGWQLDSSSNGTGTIGAVPITATFTNVKVTGPVSVEKIWDDANNQDGKRPAAVQVQLYRQVGSAEKTALGDPVTLGVNNDWKTEWTNLPEYENGAKIAYTVDEVEVPEGYTKEVKGSAEEGFTITNTHEPAKITITVNKEWLDAGHEEERPATVTIHLWMEDEEHGNILLGSAEMKKADGWQPVSFEDLELYKEGSGGKEKMLYFVIEDEINGYATQPAYPDENNLATVTNRYDREDTTAQIQVAKRLDGRAWKAGESYSFTLRNSDGGPMPESANATVTAPAEGAAEGAVLLGSFGEIKLTRDLIPEGTNSVTFHYEVVENAPEQPAGGMIYASAPHSVHITLAVKADGSLSAAVGYGKDSKPSPEAAAFVNEYRAAPVSFTVTLNKLLNGKLTGGYSFGLYDMAGNMLSRTSTNADGRLTVSPKDVVMLTAPGEYKYQIREILPETAVDGKLDGVTYDTKAVTVTVTVTDDLEGHLVSSVAYSENAGPQSEENKAQTFTPALEGITFENTYDAVGTAVLKAAKHLSGRDWTEEDAFTLTLLPVDGAPLRTSEDGASAASLSAVAVKDQRTVTFPTLYYRYADLNGEAEREFTYRVTETGELPGGITRAEDRQIKVLVADLGNGTLKVSYAKYDQATGALKEPAEWLDDEIDPPALINRYAINDEKTATLQAAKQILDAIGKAEDDWIVNGGTEDEHDWSKAEFAFVLMTINNDTPMPEGAKPRTDAERGRYVRSAVNASLASGKLASFGEIRYTKPGTYYYVIREVRPDAAMDEAGYVEGLYIHDHLIYSITSHAVQVTVADNGDGTLTEPVIEYGKSRTAEPSVFLNQEQGDAEIVLAGRKQLIGRDLEGGMFQFELYAMDDENDLAYTDEKRIDAGTVTASGIVEKTVVFSKHQLEGIEEKTFYYLGRELNLGMPGMTYSTEIHRYAVTVGRKTGSETEIEIKELKIDDGSGAFKTVELAADAETGIMLVKDAESWPVHVNTYAVEGSAILDASKHIEGRNSWKEGESFTFELTGEDGAPLRVKNEGVFALAEGGKLTATATDVQHLVDFRTLWFTQDDLADSVFENGAWVKQFTYRIHEVCDVNGDGTDDNPAAGGAEKDGLVYAADQLITLRVSDHGDGKLRVEYGSYNGWLNTPIAPQFNNIYTVKDAKEAALKVNKHLTGRAWAADDSFTFRILPVSNTALLSNDQMPMPEKDTVTVTAESGKIAEDVRQGAFGTMTFTKAGAYVYKIEEVGGSLPGVTYSQTKHQVTVRLADAGDGTLTEPEVTYARTGSSEPVTFTNPYRPEKVSYAFKGQKTMI